MNLFSKSNLLVLSCLHYFKRNTVSYVPQIGLTYFYKYMLCNHLNTILTRKFRTISGDFIVNPIISELANNLSVNGFGRAVGD